MMHRIRLALKSGSWEKLGNDGPVEVDETYVGGKPKNMHKDRRARLGLALKANHKAIVMGMLDREARKVRAKVIPDVTRLTLQTEILKEIVPLGVVYTDQHVGYDHLAVRSFVHKTVNHADFWVTFKSRAIS